MQFLYDGDDIFTGFETFQFAGIDTGLTAYTFRIVDYQPFAIGRC